MTPFTVVTNKLQHLKSQLSHHDPDAQVSMKNKSLQFSISLGPNRPDEQELRTYLRSLSSELSACLDDFLMVTNSREAMDLARGVGDGPITADRLSRVLEAAQFRLKAISAGQTVHQSAALLQEQTNGDDALGGTKPANTSSVANLRALVDNVKNACKKKKGLGSIDSYEVLAAPSGQWEKGELKVKSAPSVLAPVSTERIAKRQGLHSIVADIANLVGHEILANRPDRNDPLHGGLLDSLRAFAQLGSDGKPVSASRFIESAQLVLTQVEKSKDSSKLFNVYKDLLVKDEVRGYESAQQSDLFKLLFQTVRVGDHPLIDGLNKRLYGLEYHFKRARVQQAMSDHGVTPQEVLAVWAYTVMSRPLNASCRAGVPEAGAKEVVDLLVVALGKLRSPVTHALFRGVDLDEMAPAQIKQLTTIGSVFVDAAPLSSSYDRKRAFGNGLMIEIRPCELSRGSSILPLSDAPQEKEILFPPFTKFQVADAYKNTNGEWEYVRLVELPEK